MNICEGCIKQDVCKFQERVLKYEEDTVALEFTEPLEFALTCKYKEVEDDGDECPDNPVWRLYPYGCPPWTTWTDIKWHEYYHPICPNYDATTTCGKEW